jgi:thiamine biosynthesis lipoprotein
MKLNFIFIFAAALSPVFAAAPCGAVDHAVGDPTFVRARYLMGTICRVALDEGPEAEEAAAAAFDEIDRLESLLSTWRAQSELSRLNRAPVGAPVGASPELVALLAHTLEWSVWTDGAFNPLVAPLVDAWALRRGGRVPSPAEIRDGVRRSRLDAVAIDPAMRTVTRRSDGAFEEGGFAKGYALDRAVAVLRERGVARGWIDFGGQLAVFGFGDRPLEVAIAHPRLRQHAAVRLRLGCGSLSTSSASERTFAAGGRRFSHIVDPRTGLALPPGGSVSVLDESAFRADVLSTALYVMGPERGLAWARAHGVAALVLAPQDKDRFRLETSPAWRERVLEPAVLDAHVMKGEATR